MSSSTFTSTLVSMSSRLYVGPVRSAVRWLGLEKPVQRAHNAIIVALANDTATIEAGGYSARFHTTTYSEVAKIGGGTIVERAVMDDLVAQIRPGDVFYDIGAHLGVYACLGALAAGEDGRVVAFEPFPPNVKRLRENVRLNELDGRVDVFDRALSDADDTVEFQVTDDVCGATGNGLEIDEDESRISVKTNRGDTVVMAMEQPAPNVVKIDVEGAEQKVLDGFENTLARETCHTVYCEVHCESLPKHGGSPEAVESELEELGFRVKRIAERGPTYFLRGSREATE